MAIIKRSGSADSSTNGLSPWRIRILLLIIILLFFGILARLFYWQVVRGLELSAEADKQYQRTRNFTGERGKLHFADGQILVGNTEVFRLIFQPHLSEAAISDLATQLTTLIQDDPHVIKEFASPEGEIDDTALRAHVFERLDLPERKWVTVVPKISSQTRDKIQAAALVGVVFESYHVRSYPEASMAAHLTGFVGKNEDGLDVGYFGIEGALEHELQGRVLNTTVLTDALGRQLSAEQALQQTNTHGRDLTLTIRRDIQFLIEQELKKGVEKYQAKSGEIIILDPNTGDILAQAAWPQYDQANYGSFDQSTFHNPSLTSLYEPGSTLKTLTVAAGIDTETISPDTECTICHAARRYGRYTIRTWNDVYNPNITMTEGLAKSDNTAMIFIAERVGAETLREYLQKFGIGSRIHIDLQGDRDTPFPERWGPVELATISFGQGISTTSLQLVRAVATIANEGVMMRPRIIKGTHDPQTQEFIAAEPIIERQVISKETAQAVTDMLVVAAQEGEAQWIQSRTHTVAGKTGTSQIATSGGYDSSKTIASYIGFAPPEEPQFVMLVKLVEPGSSPWAAETAAPIWYSIAKELFLSLNIPPDQQ